MRRRIAVWMIGLAVASLGLTSAGRALADGAPPPPPPGTTIESGYEVTQVQMVSENVTITIGDDRAYVEATFWMRNQGTETESFDVRFPLGGALTLENPEAVVRDFSAYVDGKPAETRIEQEPYCPDNCPNVPWPKWPVTFPPGETLALGVLYQLMPQVPMSSSEHIYTYMLETGAGWHGPIGEGTITVHLPYSADGYTINKGKYDPQIKPSYYTLSGNEIVWQFTDLEPSQDDNISLQVMRPAVWRAWQTAEEQVQSNPESLDAHVTLAHALVNAIGRLPKGPGLEWPTGQNPDLLDRALREYEWILQHAGNVQQYHDEYIALFEDTYWSLNAPCGAFQRAKTLFPDDPDLSRFEPLSNDNCLNGVYVSPTPRVTSPPPTAIIVPTASSTPVPLPSSTPQSAPTGAPLPSSDKTPDRNSWPLIAGGAILLIGVGVWAYRRIARGG